MRTFLTTVQTAGRSGFTPFFPTRRDAVRIHANAGTQFALEPLRRPPQSISPVTQRIEPIENSHRVNEQIRISPVRVVGAAGEVLGILATAEAQKMAVEAGLDLV